MPQTEGSARESTRMKKRMEWRFHKRRDSGTYQCHFQIRVIRGLKNLRTDPGRLFESVRGGLGESVLKDLLGTPRCSVRRRSISCLPQMRGCRSAASLLLLQ